MNYKIDYETDIGTLDIHFTHHKGTTPAGGDDPTEIDIVYVMLGKLDIKTQLDSDVLEYIMDACYDYVN